MPAMRIESFGWLGLVAACAPSVPATLPDPNADVGLGEVALMVWTTRSPEGLLGHARQSQSSKVNPNCKVVEGTAHFTATDQHLVMVSEQAVELEAGAGVSGMSADARVNRATHVAFDVRVTGYLELFPKETKYVPGSGCCQGGAVSDSCGESYVTRLIRGSGKVVHLQKLGASAGVEAGDLVRARGGTTYRRLNETSFVDAFFAYQLEQLQSLCSRVAPGEEIETLAVDAPDNCWVQAYLTDGRREAQSFRVPDVALCKKLAEHHCSSRQQLAGCTASFASAGQAAPIALFEAAPPAPAEAAAPSDEATAPR